MEKSTPCDLNLFSLIRPLPKKNICIVIPVKNEEEYIAETLGAFITQIDNEGKMLNKSLFEILVLANNCTDTTVEIIKNFQKENPDLQLFLEEIELPEHQCNIGFIRRNLMETANRRLCENGGGIIMTTDGDTLVSPDWIAQTQKEIDHGAEAVGGRILLRHDEYAFLDEKTAYFHEKDEKYHLLVAQLEAKIVQQEHHKSSPHHQHFNGSFAVTTDCYRKAGGYPYVTHLEDCAFFEKLTVIDAKIRHSNKVVVHTSARCIGRTEIGLSSQLNVWKNLSKNQHDWFVESCESLTYRFKLKKKLLDLWAKRENQKINIPVEIRKIDPEIIFDDAIISTFYSNLYFGAWFAEIRNLNEKYWQEKYRADSLNKAIDDLHNVIDDYADADFSQTSMR